ncbi:hypothetical protein PC113_g14039 [Phytophthora cactorum]|uniref:Polyprotein n=1 Tax=Phytophthora cactorum TaxID=29920 RepID=A0A8T0YLI4_9STRA|nr:hypothetical protein PC113_g14039 [Phytophthora cactorum]
MSMLEYIQRAQHLISCITTHPVDMATQVHVFTSGMNAGYQRFYLTRKTPSTLEEAFAVALREDYSVTASQAFDVSRVRAPEPEPEPIEIDAIQQFDGRRGATPSTPRPRGLRPIKCFRCKKPGYRAAVCRAPAPVVANITIENDVAVTGQAKNGDNHPPVLRAHLFATTSGSDSRLIVLSLHVNGATRPVRALLDSGATNNFVRAESLSVLPADMRFDGFQGSEDFLVIELSGSFDCVFGIPWLARHQPHIDWLTRTVRPRDIDVNAVLAFLSGTPDHWPHVAVMDPDSMTTAVSEESDGPSCTACERATCAGPDPDPQDILDVVEHGFPRTDEQWLSRDDVIERGLPHAVGHEFPHVVERELPANEDETVVERGLPQAVETELPRVVERELPGTTAVVEHGLPQAVERGLPHVVERELPEVVDAVESSIPHPDPDPVGRCHESADISERGFSSSAAESAPRPVRRRGRHTPRRPRILSACSASTELEVISALVGDGDDSVAHVREVEVARPPCDAASITQLPGLSCMIVPVADGTVAAVEVDAGALASDSRTRPKHAEPKTGREARYAAQSLPALEASGTPVAPLVREFIEIFPEKVPAVLPPDRGVRHEIDLTPGAKYCVTRQ